MKPHGVGPVALFVSLIFCSSLSAQTDQPFSVQVSGLALWTNETGGSIEHEGWGRSVEGQIRWTGGSWSLGVGVQSTSTSRSETAFFTSPGPDGTSPGPDGEWGTSDDFSLQSDYDSSTLGIFLEPRLVVMAFADRFGLYVFGRVAVSRISETVTGTRSTELPDIGASLVPTQPEAYSLDVTRTGFGGYLGPGLLVRLTSRVNLDMGLTAGFGSLGKPEPRVEPGLTVENSVKYWYALGTWVGLVIGIG